MADEVRYEQRGRIALITLNRPRYANAQNSAMTYALDAAFTRAVNDEQVAVLVLAGAGKHFCAGHDIGTPERDADKSFERQAVLWWDHVGRDGADARYAREMEVYLGMCRRWRELPEARHRHGARRDRLHRRARPQPVAGQGPGARPGLGQPGRAPRPRGGGAQVSLTGEQQDLRDAVRGLLARAGDDLSQWRRLCREVGVGVSRFPSATAGRGPGPPRPAWSWRNSAGN